MVASDWLGDSPVAVMETTRPDPPAPGAASYSVLRPFSARASAVSGAFRRVITTLATRLGSLERRYGLSALSSLRARSARIYYSLRTCGFPTASLGRASCTE